MVWINMLPNDSAEAAQRSARLIQDVRIRHFHDPKRFVGQAIAESIGASGHVAWDMYLFYSGASEWGETPPKPTDWAHQLSDEWAGKDHFAWGGDLNKRLKEIAANLLRH